MTEKKIDILFTILGKSWKARLLTKSYYKKKHGNDSVAISLLHKRKIDFSPKGFDLETVVHELTHAYLYELCTHSADISTEAIHEVFAELMAKRGYELLRTADSLYKQILDITGGSRVNE